MISFQHMLMLLKKPESAGCSMAEMPFPDKNCDTPPEECAEELAWCKVNE
jgi:hypothetical protein